MAERGRGATMNGEAIRVSSVDTLDQALLVTGLSLRHPHDGGDEPARVRGALGPGPGGPAARLGGARPLLGGLRAARRLLGVLARPVGHGGGRAHRQEAGGRVTSVHGGPWRLEGPGILASNGLVHDAILSGWAPRRRRGRDGRPAGRAREGAAEPHPLPVHVRTHPHRRRGGRSPRPTPGDDPRRPPGPRQPRGPASPGRARLDPARRRRHPSHGGDADRHLARSRRDGHRRRHAHVPARRRVPRRAAAAPVAGRGRRSGAGSRER